MIILEGPDLVGKTTLAHRLLKTRQLQYSGHTYAHLSRLPDGFHRYWDYVLRSSPNLVQDRFHMSEPVYAQMRGDLEKSALDPETYRLVDGALRLRGALTVLVVCDPQVIRERYAARASQEMYREDEVVAVSDLFWQIAQGGRLVTDRGVYHPDVDHVVRCDRHHPYPDDSDVEQVLTLYMRRRNQLDLVQSTRKSGGLV